MESEVFERVEEVIKLVKAMYRENYRWARYAEAQDVVSEGVAWVLENAWRYNPSKGSFATFVCMSAKNGMSTFLRNEWERQKRNCSLDGFEELLESQELDLYDVGKENVKEVLKLCEDWDERKKSIIYGLANGRTQIELAREMGLSRQYVSYTFKQFKEVCAEKYKYEDGLVSEKKAVEK